MLGKIKCLLRSRLIFDRLCAQESGSLAAAALRAQRFFRYYVR